MSHLTGFGEKIATGNPAHFPGKQWFLVDFPKKTNLQISLNG
jgi:hypothetical protein